MIVMRGIHLNLCSCGGRPEVDYGMSILAPFIRCTLCGLKHLFRRGIECEYDAAVEWNKLAEERKNSATDTPLLDEKD